MLDSRLPSFGFLPAYFQESVTSGAGIHEVTGQKTVKKSALLELNQKALEAGRQFIDQQVRVGAVSQPDGFAY